MSPFPTFDEGVATSITSAGDHRLIFRPDRGGSFALLFLGAFIEFSGVMFGGAAVPICTIFAVAAAAGSVWMSIPRSLEIDFQAQTIVQFIGFEPYVYRTIRTVDQLDYMAVIKHSRSGIFQFHLGFVPMATSDRLSFSGSAHASIDLLWSGNGEALESYVIAIADRFERPYQITRSRWAPQPGNLKIRFRK